MNILDSKYQFPEPEKSLNMEKLFSYLEKLNNTLKSPFQIENNLHENFKLSVGNQQIIVERYSDIGQLQYRKSTNCIDSSTKKTIIQNLSNNLEMLVSAMSETFDDLRKYLILMEGIIKILYELSQMTFDSDFVEVSEYVIAEDSLDLGLIIFQIISGLLVNNTVSVICYSPDLYLPLHILNSIISPLCSDNIFIIFAKSPNNCLTNQKSISLVYADADLRNASKFLLDSYGYFNGKSSMNASIFLVQQNVYQKFKDQVTTLCDMMLLKESPHHLSKDDELLIEKHMCDRIHDKATIFEASASIIDRLTTGEFDCSLIIPFRTAKESLTMVKALKSKQILNSDLFRNYKHGINSINLFSFNSNALYQIANLIEGFNSMFINGDYIPAYNTSLYSQFRKYQSQRLLPLLTESFVTTQNTELEKLAMKMKKEAEIWSQSPIHCRWKKISQAYPKLDLSLITDSILSLDEQSQVISHQISIKLNTFMTLRHCKNPFGVVFLRNKSNQNIETIIAHCLLAGNTIMLNSLSTPYEIPETLKNLVSITDADPESIRKLGIAVVKPASENCNTNDFLFSMLIATPIGNELFAN